MELFCVLIVWLHDYAFAKTCRILHQKEWIIPCKSFFLKFKKRNGKVISYPSTSFSLSAQRRPQPVFFFFFFQCWSYNDTPVVEIESRLAEIFLGMIFFLRILKPGNHLFHYIISQLFWLTDLFFHLSYTKLLELRMKCLFSYPGVSRIYLVYLTPSGYSVSICWKNRSLVLSTKEMWK